MTGIVRTHRGFVVPVEITDDPKIQWYGNATITQLYNDLNDDRVDCNQWVWQERAIEVVQDVLNRIPGFFGSQLVSGLPMPARCIDFLHSTFLFIKTGQRKLSTFNWMDLLEIHPVTMPPVNWKVTGDFRAEFDELPFMSPHKLIPLWLSQPMGLQDMVLTAYILFGTLDYEK